VRRQAPHLKEKKRNEKGTRPFSVNKQGEKKEKGEKGESPRFSQIREDLDLHAGVYPPPLAFLPMQAHFGGYIRGP
jgi:hypothetical protein